VTMVRFERENFKAKEELLHNEKERVRDLSLVLKR